MTLAIFIGIIFVIILIVGFNDRQKQKKREEIKKDIIKNALHKMIEENAAKEIELQKLEEQKQSISNNIDFAFSFKEISEVHRIFLHNKLNSEWWPQYDFDKMIQKCKSLLNHENSLIDKYGKDTAQKLINQEYWIGMTDQQLIDSKGEPDKIEKEILKTKTKEIYIYGNKSSGDYFVIENNLVIKIVDR